MSLFISRKLGHVALAAALSFALALPAVSDAQAQRRPIGEGTLKNPNPRGGATIASKGRGVTVERKARRKAPGQPYTVGSKPATSKGIQNKGVKGCETCVDGGAGARGRAVVRVPRQF